MNKETTVDGFGALAAALAAQPPDSYQAMDRSHALLVAGLIAAHKPKAVLELGVGSGYLTRVLLAALGANGGGRLSSVDNFFDWNGAEPAHIAALRASAGDWTLITRDETEFLRQAGPETYDLVISDGDHPRGYMNAVDVLRVCRVGGLAVFHDTNNPLFRLLGRVPKRCRQLGFPCWHYTNAGAGERTDRGLLVVGKDRARRFTPELAVRLYLLWRDRRLPV